MGDLKYIIWPYLAGAVVFWVAGINLVYYSIGYVVLIVCFFIALEHWSNSEEEKRKVAAEEKKQKIAAMTKEERKLFAEQERVDRDIANKKYQLALKEQQLKNKERALAQQEQEQRRKGKVPFAVKAATSAVVGYKIGKKIGKW
jgi:uncharacterized protein YoxC